MAERLTPLDHSFLRVETPSAHMHVALRARFLPPAGSAPITLDRVAAMVASRLGLSPRFRQRLAFPPGGTPVWVDDADFDLRRHVFALGEGEESLTLKEFARRVDAELSLPLARDRPLWSLHVAPCLADGTVGILLKGHHAMVEGVSGIALATLLLDFSPDVVEPPPAPDWAPRGAPGAGRMALETLGGFAEDGLRLPRAIAGSGGRGIGGILRGAALSLGEDVLRPAPASFVNAPIGPRRALASHVTPIAPLLEAKAAFGVTLNDIVLALVAGALRQIALLRNVAPAPLKAMVPVNTRGDKGGYGNQIAFVMITLPLHVRRTQDRIAAVAAETRRFKEGGRAAGSAALMGSLGFLPGPLQGRAAKLAASPRMYNLVVSNVPGPRVPVYLLGAECVEAVPVVPISEGHALSIGVLSLHDRLCFGAYGEPAALPEVSDLPGALSASALELAAATRAQARRAERSARRASG